MIEFLMGLLVGLIVGATCGMAFGENCGRIDERRKYLDAQPEQPVATWERMRGGNSEGMLR